MKLKDFGKGAAMFAVAGGGLAGSAFGLKKLDGLIPASVPAIARQILPGLAVAAAAFYGSTKVGEGEKGKAAKAFLLGLGAGGMLDLLRKTLGPRIAFLNDYLPALSGTPGYRAINVGGTGWDYYRDNSLQGTGTGNSFALNGGNTPSMQGFSMQGPGGQMSAANAYAFNGVSDAYAFN